MRALNKLFGILGMTFFIISIFSNLIYASRVYHQYYELKLSNGCVKHTYVITFINGTVTQYWNSFVVCPGSTNRIGQNNSSLEVNIESGKINMIRGNPDDDENKLFQIMADYDKNNLIGKKLSTPKIDELIKERDKIVRSYYGKRIISTSSKPPRDLEESKIKREIDLLKNEIINQQQQ
ncbi:MAG: hypothetical protein AB1432_14185 [Bacteroidota bacterium]